MKSKDLQTLLFSKYQNGDGPTKLCNILMVPLAFLQSTGDAIAFEKPEVSTCQDQLVARE